MEMMSSISRRDLLKAAGALVVSFGFGAAVPRRAMAQTTARATAAGKLLDPAMVDSFLAVRSDGSVTVYTGKADVGTGLRIAIPQMVADELGVPIERISIVDGDTGLTPDQGSTGGSTGLTRGGVEVRQAAATAREALIELGARRLNRRTSELTIAAGEVRPVAGGAGIGIGTLLVGDGFELAVNPKAALKAPSSYTVVGKSLPRPDVPDKTTGRHPYVQNVKLPGMRHARVVRPPAIGAKLLSIDESSIRNIPGVRVVRIENFLAVVAGDEWAAIRAAQELKTTWSEWKGLPDHDRLESHLRNGAVDRDQALVNKGNPPGALSSAATRVSGTYFWPCQGHASLGPSCAVADVRSDGTTVWSGSQNTHVLARTLAKIFSLSADTLRVVFLEGSGSYGTNGSDSVAADAVLLSKTLGQPVRVQWSRQEEHAWDPKGPPQLIDVRAGLDAQNRIVAWETEMWVPASRPGERPLLAPEAAGLAQDNGLAAGLLSQNADPPYEAENVGVVVHWLKDTPLRPSNIRAPGKIANVFAVESTTDELAAAAGEDPVAFRLNRLTDRRAIDALTRVTQAFGWQPRVAPNRQARQGNLLIGRGVAYARYKQAENYVAMALEVAVNPATGKIDVRRIVCAHDCGLVVNEDAVKNQVEGCIIQTLSRTLHEDVKFDSSRVTSVDWTSYPILRFPEVPAVDVIVINRPDQPIIGAGEAATVTVPAALANAVFDATGVRLRTVPFTADRMKAALART